MLTAAGFAPRHRPPRRRRRIFIEDRKKDVIVVSGFKVYPNEIEDAAAQRGARGRRHRRAGQAIGRGREAIHRAQRSELTEADVIAHARANLTGYKVPATSSSSRSCRRAMSGRCCAARSKLEADTRRSSAEQVPAEIKKQADKTADDRAVHADEL
jgi:acyl-CoA synthetase (AMP-forming)/AMP-acid ligase II